jgi:uncharacterized protein (TIGR02246 family)
MTNAALQVLDAKDRALIDDVVAKYDRSIDGGDKEEFLSLFTPTGAWVSPMMGTFEGHDAIGAWFDDFYASKSPFHGGQHRVTNEIFSNVTENRVEMWSNWIHVGPLGDGPQVLVMGNYLDVFVKEDGRWLFENRTIQITSQSEATKGA